MIITAVKTHKITLDDKNILDILDTYIKDLKEGSVVAVTSKIVSICEGSVVKLEDAQDKDALIEENSQYYLARNENKYNVSFTITNNILSASAGIDESNGNGFFVLWPKGLQQSANNIREHLTEKFNLKKLGVIITDSKTTPLRWGVTGMALSHSGFSALNDYIGKLDLFGRPFQFEKLNVADSLASAAVLEMGEGDEQTPLAVIEGIGNINYQDRNPTVAEIEELKIDMKDDLFAPFLEKAEWKKGKRD